MTAAVLSHFRFKSFSHHKIPRQRLFDSFRRRAFLISRMSLAPGCTLQHFTTPFPSFPLCGVQFSVQGSSGGLPGLGGHSTVICVRFAVYY